MTPFEVATGVWVEGYSTDIWDSERNIKKISDRHMARAVTRKGIAVSKALI